MCRVAKTDLKKIFFTKKESQPRSSRGSYGGRAKLTEVGGSLTEVEPGLTKVGGESAEVQPRVLQR